MQPKFMKSAAALALFLAGTMHAALAAPIVATPGSLAGYTYFPAATGSSGGGSGTDNVGTLQRCFWSPTEADYTLNLASTNWYDYGDTRPLTIYYKIVGGNGGGGFTGGGGGSSALLKNGTLVALGPGGNGGTPTTARTASTVEGSVVVGKTDTLRFVTGGGGGDGSHWLYLSGYYGFSGGGGGSGYTAGGGGASSNSNVTTAQVNLLDNMGGKGGGASPGQGGVASNLASNMPGTAGNGTTGGVGTFPDGSSAPIGSFDANGMSSFYCNVGPFVCSGAYRHPATFDKPGSHGYPVFGSVAVSTVNGYAPGNGGALGMSGVPTASMYTDAYQGGTIRRSLNTSAGYISYGNSPSVQVYGTKISSYPKPTSFEFTRQHDASNPVSGGALPGQIVIMYQAPVCSIFK